MKKAFSILFIALFLNGCGHSSYTTTEGGVRPEKPNFDLAREPFKLPPNSIIDTDSIYLYVGKSRAAYNEGKDIWSFLRFFPEGQVYLSHGDGAAPSDVLYENLSRGTIGYYRLTGNSLECEFYIPVYGDRYHRYYGSISEEKIYLSRSEHGSFPRAKTKIDKTFYKHKKKNLKAKPDW